MNFEDEDRFTYFEQRKSIHDYYIKCSQPPHSSSFPTLQGITSYIIDQYLDISEVDDLMLFIALGVEAMKNGEILSRVKRTLMGYIGTNAIEKFKDEIPPDEYSAMKEDLEAFRLFPPESLKEIPDFK